MAGTDRALERLDRVNSWLSRPMLTFWAAAMLLAVVAGSLLKSVDPPERRLVRRKCNRCHDLSVLYADRKDAAVWNDVVLDHQRRQDVRLTPAQQATIVRYLTTRRTIG